MASITSFYPNLFAALTGSLILVVSAAWWVFRRQKRSLP